MGHMAIINGTIDKEGGVRTYALGERQAGSIVL